MKVCFTVSHMHEDPELIQTVHVILLPTLLGLIRLENVTEVLHLKSIHELNLTDSLL